VGHRACGGGRRAGNALEQIENIGHRSDGTPLWNANMRCRNGANGLPVPNERSAVHFLLYPRKRGLSNPF
jgi:hypothetical protein